ncbi:MFS transporter [Spirillospora sp. NPDC047279]|uniref:MFS transporter n=1 Tax=Spirillospora sp. NPDC047279 TaxID=3155478 RepID=UPI0033D5A5A0
MTTRKTALPLYLSAATLLRVSAEGLATALVLTVQARTGNAATAGFLQTALTLPYILSGPVVGHKLDQAARPRRLVVALALGYAVAAGLLLLIAGESPLMLAIVVALVIGCTEPIVVGITSLVPRFVPPDRLTRAYGLEASSYNAAAIVGPGLAAGMAAWAGGASSGIPIVLCAVLGLLALPLLPLPGLTRPSPTTLTAPADPPADSGAPSDPAAPAGSGVGREAGALADVVTGGLLVLASNRVLRALTAATTLAWLGFGGVAVTAVLLAERLGADPSAGGQLLVAMAIGSLAGSLACARWLGVRHAERVMLAGLAGFGLALAGPAVAPSLSWAMLCFFVAGICEGPVFASTLMLRQRESPPDRLGQVNTTGGSLKIGASAIGAALTGTFAAKIGPVGLVLAIAACQFAGVVVGFVLLSTKRKDGRSRP